MILINLIPWREHAREERKRQFFQYLGVALTSTIALVVCIHILYNNKVSVQNQRNHYLTQEIEAVKKQNITVRHMKAQKQQLLTRMEVIMQLQANRSLLVQMFDAMLDILPSGIYLESIKQNSNLVTIKGIADANTNVSRLMRQIEHSSYLHRPELHEIKTDDKTLRRFQLQMRLGNLKPQG